MVSMIFDHSKSAEMICALLLTHAKTSAASLNCKKTDICNVPVPVMCTACLQITCEQSADLGASPIEGTISI